MKKINRVTKSKDFGRIITAGQTKTSKSFVVSVLQNDLGYVRVGISVSKKRGNAVRRNYIKRQVRSICRSQIDFSNNYDFIIVIRQNYDPDQYAEMEKELKQLIDHLQRSYHASKD